MAGIRWRLAVRNVWRRLTARSPLPWTAAESGSIHLGQGVARVLVATRGEPVEVWTTVRSPDRSCVGVYDRVAVHRSPDGFELLVDIQSPNIKLAWLAISKPRHPKT